MCESVYFLRNDLLWKEGVYKVGRSSNCFQRVKSYGKGTRVLRQVNVDNSFFVEEKLVDAFREVFSVATGKEYFLCPEEEALKLFDKVVERNRQTLQCSPKPIKDIISPIQEITATKHLEIYDKRRSIFTEFEGILFSCKKKNVLNGVLSLLCELKKKTKSLWVFKNGEVHFECNGISKKEQVHDRGDMYAIFARTMEVCAEECRKEVTYSLGSTSALKVLLEKSEGYYTIKYETFWQYLEEKENFA